MFTVTRDVSIGNSNTGILYIFQKSPGLSLLHIACIYVLEQYISYLWHRLSETYSKLFHSPSSFFFDMNWCWPWVFLLLFFQSQVWSWHSRSSRSSWRAWRRPSLGWRPSKRGWKPTTTPRGPAMLWRPDSEKQRWEITLTPDFTPDIRHSTSDHCFHFSPLSSDTREETAAVSGLKAGSLSGDC